MASLKYGQPVQRADGVQPGRRGLREVVAKGGGTGAEESYGAEEHEGAEAHSTIAPPVFRRRACSGQTRPRVSVRYG